MKSTEFLMEAEANLAQKKLDTYLDMLSDDNLRSLIPMLKKEVQLDEAVNPELYNRLAARKGQVSSTKTDSPKPVTKQPSSTPKPTADPEASKVQQTISSLSTAEKKELLSLLQKEAKTRPAAKKSAQKQDSADKKSTGKGMMGCLLPLVGIVGLLSLIPDTNADRLSRMGAAATDHSSLGTDVGVDYSNPIDNVSLRQYGWDKVAYGSIMEVNFEIVNFNPYAVKDIEIKCTHYAPSGTEIDSNTRTIYDIIPADGSKKFNNFNMGFIHDQAATTSCEIISVEKT